MTLGPKKNKKREVEPEYRINQKVPRLRNVFMNQVLDSECFKAESGVFTASGDSLMFDSVDKLNMT